MKSDCTCHNCVFGDRALFVEEVGHGKVGKVGKTTGALLLTSLIKF